MTKTIDRPPKDAPDQLDWPAAMALSQNREAQARAEAFLSNWALESGWGLSPRVAAAVAAADGRPLDESAGPVYDRGLWLSAHLKHDPGTDRDSVHGLIRIFHDSSGRLSGNHYSRLRLGTGVVDLALAEHLKDNGLRHLVSRTNFDPVSGQRTDGSSLYFRLDGTPASESFSRYHPAHQRLIEETHRQLFPDGSVHQQKSTFYQQSRRGESRRSTIRPKNCPEPDLWWLDWLAANPEPGRVVAGLLLAT